MAGLCALAPTVRAIFSRVHHGLIRTCVKTREISKTRHAPPQRCIIAHFWPIQRLIQQPSSWDLRALEAA